MREKLNHVIPLWAISEAEIQSLELPNGFLRDFLEYVGICTDAPQSFALGTGFGILATACGQCDLVIQKEGGRSATRPIRLWQALVGNSGQRKSKVMDLGIGLLQLTGSRFLLPCDGSIEALHDTLAEQPISLWAHEELSNVLDAQIRGYTQGLQSYLLSIWSGTPRDRKTKAGGFIDIQRPRLNILGAIPPEVFFEKTKNLDWKSGFLPRFIFWGGLREEWQDDGISVPSMEKVLAQTLQYVHIKSDGQIIIPPDVGKILSRWFFENIESHATGMIEDTYAGLLRLQENGQTFAGLIAASRVSRSIKSGVGGNVVVSESDMNSAVKLLNLLKRTIECVSGKANETKDMAEENAVVEILKTRPEGYTLSEIRENMKTSYTKIRTLIAELMAAQIVTMDVRSAKGRGQPARLFRLVEKP